MIDLVIPKEVEKSFLLFVNKLNSKEVSLLDQLWVFNRQVKTFRRFAPSVNDMYIYTDKGRLSSLANHLKDPSEQIFQAGIEYVYCDLENLIKFKEVKALLNCEPGWYFIYGTFRQLRKIVLFD